MLQPNCRARRGLGFHTQLLGAAHRVPDLAHKVAQGVAQVLLVGLALALGVAAVQRMSLGARRHHSHLTQHMACLVQLDRARCV